MTTKAGGASRSRPLEIRRNDRNVVDGLTLLQTIKRGEAKAAFLDPQYRALLDKQGYGNEGESREKARAVLPQMTNYDIGMFVAEIANALAPGGHLFLWLDKFSIGSGHHVRFLAHAPVLKLVDLLAWNKMRPGMGRRFRCRTEYLVVAQKEPTRAKGVWSDHRLDDCWPEQSDRSVHPHAKPYQLTERLIRAVTKRGDLVIDPCAGSYTVLEACKASGREFLGCDLKP